MQADLVNNYYCCLIILTLFLTLLVIATATLNTSNLDTLYFINTISSSIILIVLTISVTTPITILVELLPKLALTATKQTLISTAARSFFYTITNPNT